MESKNMRRVVEEIQDVVRTANADQLREISVKMSNEYHENMKNMDISQDNKRLIVNMAHNNQMYEHMLIDLLEECGYFERK